MKKGVIKAIWAWHLIMSFNILSKVKIGSFIGLKCCQISKLEISLNDLNDLKIFMATQLICNVVSCCFNHGIICLLDILHSME